MLEIKGEKKNKEKKGEKQIPTTPRDTILTRLK